LSLRFLAARCVSGPSKKGIAPKANLLDLRVLDLNGLSSGSVVIAAIEKAVQSNSNYNVRVINLSLGRPIHESCHRDPLCQAVESSRR
jgi:serine protease AprX